MVQIPAFLCCGGNTLLHSGCSIYMKPRVIPGAVVAKRDVNLCHSAHIKTIFRFFNDQKVSLIPTGPWSIPSFVHHQKRAYMACTGFSGCGGECAGLWEGDSHLQASCTTAVPKFFCAQNLYILFKNYWLPQKSFIKIFEMYILEI